MLEWTSLREYLRKARLVIKMHSGSPVDRQATSKLRLHAHYRFETVNMAYEILNLGLCMEWQVDVWGGNTGFALKKRLVIGCLTRLKFWGLQQRSLKLV